MTRITRFGWTVLCVAAAATLVLTLYGFHKDLQSRNAKSAPAAKPVNAALECANQPRLQIMADCPTSISLGTPGSNGSAASAIIIGSQSIYSLMLPKKPYVDAIVTMIGVAGQKPKLRVSYERSEIGHAGWTTKEFELGANGEKTILIHVRHPWGKDAKITEITAL